MFAQNVARIFLPSDVMNVDNACCNCMSHSMVGQCDPTLIHFGMGNGCGIDYRIVVTKHHCSTIDRCSEVPKCEAQINDLLSACSRGDVLGTQCSCLNS